VHLFALFVLIEIDNFASKLLKVKEFAFIPYLVLRVQGQLPKLYL
jgi:hypothetical protein